MTSRRKLLAAAALAAVVAPLTALSPLAHAEEQKAQLMLVQTAEDLKANDKTLRLVNVGQQTLYFSDRPVRIAGHMSMPAYLDEWKEGAGADNFAADPPNATLSFVEDKDLADAVVVLRDLALEGEDLSYEVEILEGEIPASAGMASLFIDIIGMPRTPLSFAGVRRRAWQRAVLY